jgi:hypothetical protein
MTQFGPLLYALNLDILWVNTPQSKGLPPLPGKEYRKREPSSLMEW